MPPSRALQADTRDNDLKACLLAFCATQQELKPIFAEDDLFDARRWIAKWLLHTTSHLGEYRDRDAEGMTTQVQLLIPKADIDPADWLRKSLAQRWQCLEQTLWLTTELKPLWEEAKAQPLVLTGLPTEAKWQSESCKEAAQRILT